MPRKNIATGTNHIKVPLPQGERKEFALLTIKSDDYDWLEKVALGEDIAIADLISELIESEIYSGGVKRD